MMVGEELMSKRALCYHALHEEVDNAQAAQLIAGRGGVEHDILL